MTLVVDASVAMKWLVPEDGTEEALRLLASGEALHAPDLIYLEAANALWKRVQRRQMPRGRADTVLGALTVMPMIRHETRAMVPSALTIASALNITVYDAVYVALAELLDTAVVTADRRLVDTLKGTKMAERCRLLGHPDDWGKPRGREAW